MLNGIDISSHQAGLNVYDMTTCDFIIVKGTEGTGYVNPYCDKWVQDTLNSGKKMGFYHFASGTDAIAEADYFVAHCTNYFGLGIPVLDFEADAVSRGPEWARMFMQRVYERTKVRCLIYMSESVVRQYDWSNVAKDYGLWVAKYPNVSRPGFDYNPPYPGGTGAWGSNLAMWQYASDGSIVGYNDSLDLNHFYGDAVAWDKFAKGDREGGEDMDQETKDMIKEVHYMLTRNDDVTGRDVACNLYERNNWLAARCDALEKQHDDMCHKLDEIMLKLDDVQDSLLYDEEEDAVE